MFLLLATAGAADLPASAGAPADPAERARLSEYYGRRLRQDAELVGERWTVFEGGLALASRDFAVKVGDDDGVRRMNRARAAWLGLGGGLAAAGLAWTALLTVPAAVDPSRERDVGPFFALVTGPALAALPLVTVHLASRPRRAPVSAFYDEPAADRLIASYNRALALALALDPAGLDPAPASRAAP